MSKEIKIDFFKVVLPDEVKVPFEDLLNQVGSIPISKRHAKMGSAYVRLQEFKRWSTCYVGDLIKIRLIDLPSKADMSGNVGPLPLKDHEGVSEGTAFLYDPKTKVVVLQRNRNAVSFLGFSNYFADKAGLGGEMALASVLLPDAYQKLASMEIVQKIELSVAGLENPKAFSGQGHGLNRFLDLRDTFQANLINVVLSVGKERNSSLKTSLIRSTARQVQRILGTDQEGKIKKLRLRGKRGEDNPPEIVDLLRDRMAETEEVVSDSDRRISFEVRVEAVQNAWAKRRKELEFMHVASGESDE